jgi:hypothetical protein
MVRVGDEEAFVGVARLVAREADERQIAAQARARLRRGDIDARTRSLAHLERSLERVERAMLNRMPGPPLDEAMEHVLELDERRNLELEERRMRLLELEERISRMRLPHMLLDDFLDEEEDFWSRPLAMHRREYLPNLLVQPREPPPPPTHIQEYEDFNRSADMTFTNAAEGVELATASPHFDPRGLFLKRVTACIGWAVHGLIFEFVNGKRMGAILVDFGDRSLNLSDESIEKRAGVGWTDINYGDYIVGMHGDRLADPEKMWFCHTLVLEFYSGKSIRYEAKHEPWRGLPFSYTVPQPCLVYRIAFKYEQGEDMLGLKTSIHLPVKQGNMALLPTKYKTCVKEILIMGRTIDADRESSGKKPLGDDVWWRILSMLHGWQLLPPAPTEEEEEVSAESSSEEEQNRGGGERGSFLQRVAGRGGPFWFGVPEAYVPPARRGTERGWGPPSRGGRERSRGRLGSF